MLDLSLSITGYTTQDLLDALEETVRLVREGYTSTAGYGRLKLSISGEEEDDPNEEE